MAPGLSAGALLMLARLSSVLGFVLMAVRGIFGKWIYRKSAAARIRRIRQEFPDPDQRRAVLAAQGGTSWLAVLGGFVLLSVPDPDQRRAVLAAQGGTSWLAVLGGFVLLSVASSAVVLLMGPNLDAVVRLLYG